MYTFLTFLIVICLSIHLLWCAFRINSVRAEAFIADSSPRFLLSLAHQTSLLIPPASASISRSVPASSCVRQRFTLAAREAVDPQMFIVRRRGGGGGGGDGVILLMEAPGGQVFSLAPLAKSSQTEMTRNIPLLLRLSVALYFGRRTK